jgi:hypothetical protein
MGRQAGAWDSKKFIFRLHVRIVVVYFYPHGS